MSIQNFSIKVFDEIGGNGAVSVEDGESIYKKIERAFQEGVKVTLDFQNIKLITSAFLNPAIGQLYGKFSGDEIKEKLSLINVAQEDLSVFKQVVDRAKEYFINKNNLPDPSQNG